MNYLTDKILRGTHRLYVNHYGSYLKPIDSIMDPEKASNIIYQQLIHLQWLLDMEVQKYYA